MDNHQIRQALAEINNELYYEKLGPILSRLHAWLAEKNTAVA